LVRAEKRITRQTARKKEMPETTIMAAMPPFHSRSVHIGLGQGITQMTSPS
jgi:hypothetical protein